MDTISAFLPSPIPAHPRLLATSGDWERLRAQLGSDKTSSRIFSALEAKAEQLLEIPALERTMTGYRLLAVSRKALERISLLSVVACVGGEARFARRAIAEMMQLANFCDWNPSHYLDTAEMALAVAIGYDWLHSHLSPGEREAIAAALREKGIAPSLGEPEQWFIRGNNNWNQVCHAGVSAAAIALADCEPELCQQMLKRAVENLSAAASAYAPDGAYPEGPTYWNYGTLFHTVLAGGLQRFLGTTCGVDAYEGFAASAEYIAQVTTPTGQFYPYADSRSTRHLLIPLFWFARQFHRPDWLEADQSQIDRYMDLYESGQTDDDNYRLLALALLWHDPLSSALQSSEKRLHWLGKGPMPVAVHRSATNDSQALYAAIKGGSPSLNHAHMDAGSFMIQSEGVVWGLDPGMQEYESLESLGVNLWDARQQGTRWSIFRLGPEGHNILRFNGAAQKVDGNAQFVRFEANGPTPHSVLDLSPVYVGQAASVHRGLMFLENRALLLQDEWVAGDTAVTVSWQFLTTAQVDCQPDNLTLTEGSKRLVLQLLEPAELEIRVIEADSIQEPYDAINLHTRRITITLCTGAGLPGRLRILAVPEAACGILPPLPLPLLDWSAPLK